MLIFFAFISPASADYIGPDREVTTASEVCKMVLYECMYVEAKGEYRYHQVENWSCSNESKPWEAYENSTVDCEPWNVGRTYYDKNYSVITTTITHPEATIAGQLQNCTLQNGWCVTPSQIELNANEPLSGHQILLIEGIRNSEIFACGEKEITCQIPLLEGTNTLEYWAISSWGDSSRKGSMTVQVDTVAPNLNLLVNGTLGLNNWYVSDTIITAEGADGTSGIYEKVLSIDNQATWLPSTTLTDGVYTVDIKITDNAYNVSTASTTIQVDTTTPTLSLSVSGTQGNKDYYTSQPKITATTSDATSGVANVQAKIDNGNWLDTNEITLPDGIHTYQFRVYDNAGNMTETPVQQIAVDTMPPSVEADAEINLGDIVFYSFEDNGSGLAISRIVIEDEDEKYKKVVWLENITGNKLKDQIQWDGKFADKTLAGVGQYFITFKISDQAGNETFYTTLVNVNPISYFQTIPEFIPPVSEEPLLSEGEGQGEGDLESTTEQNFGGTTNPSTPMNNSQTLISLTGTATAGASTNTTTTSNILWGAGAAAVIGVVTAYALEQQKKREEEEAAQIAQVTAEVEAKNAAIEANRIAMLEQLKIRNWLEGQAILNAQIEKLESQGATPEQIAVLREQGATQGFGVAHENATTLSQLLTIKDILVSSGKPLYSPTSEDDLPPATLPALDWLIALYENDELPGETLLERTQFILEATQNGLFVHFANIPSGDSGFNRDFQDSGTWPNSDDQVGHFLTALDLSIWANDPNISSLVGGIRNQIALSAIIGHEMIGDDIGVLPFVINSNQVIHGFYYNVVTFGSLNRWFLSGEDDNLQKIIDLGPHVFNTKIDYFSSGNSIEDLRLSYQGWVAGQQITNGEIETSEDFAKWLEENLK